MGGAAAEEDEEEEDVGEEGAAAGVEEEGAAFACFSVWCGVAARPRGGITRTRIASRTLGLVLAGRSRSLRKVFLLRQQAPRRRHEDRPFSPASVKGLIDGPGGRAANGGGCVARLKRTLLGRLFHVNSA